MSIEIQKSVIDFLKNESRPAANRLVRYKEKNLSITNVINVNGKDYANPRYLENFLTELYRQFISLANQEAYPLARLVKWNSFYRYAKNWRIFKNPSIMSDLCDYCYWANSKFKEINEFLMSDETYVPKDKIYKISSANS